MASCHNSCINTKENNGREKLLKQEVDLECHDRPPVWNGALLPRDLLASNLFCATFALASPATTRYQFKRFVSVPLGAACRAVTHCSARCKRKRLFDRIEELWKGKYILKYQLLMQYHVVEKTNVNHEHICFQLPADTSYFFSARMYCGEPGRHLKGQRSNVQESVLGCINEEIPSDIIYRTQIDEISLWCIIRSENRSPFARKSQRSRCQNAAKRGPSASNCTCRRAGASKCSRRRASNCRPNTSFDRRCTRPNLAAIARS